MKAAGGIRYVAQDGSFTIAGLALMQDLDRRVRAAEARLEAIAAVVAPTGGATTDAEARTAIAAIIAGAA